MKVQEDIVNVQKENHIKVLAEIRIRVRKVSVFSFLKDLVRTHLWISYLEVEEKNYKNPWVDIVVPNWEEINLMNSQVVQIKHEDFREIKDIKGINGKNI